MSVHTYTYTMTNEYRVTVLSHEGDFRVARGGPFTDLDEARRLRDVIPTARVPRIEERQVTEWFPLGGKG